jgi:hypothetical protein
VSAVHPKDLIDMVLGLKDKVKDLQGQLSAATPRIGTATMSAGAVTVSLPTLKATNRIMLTIQVPGGTVGAVYVFSKTPGTGFVINSTSGTDTSTVAYAVY